MGEACNYSATSCILANVSGTLTAYQPSVTATVVQHTDNRQKNVVSSIVLTSPFSDLMHVIAKRCMMKTVFIILSKGSGTVTRALPLDVVMDSDESFADISHYFEHDTRGALFHFTHQQTNTTLHLCGVSPYTLLFFDEQLHFTGATQSIQRGSGDFDLQTQSKYLLFVRLPHNLPLQRIIQLKIKK